MLPFHTPPYFPFPDQDAAPDPAASFAFNVEMPARVWVRYYPPEDADAARRRAPTGSVFALADGGIVIMETAPLGRSSFPIRIGPGPVPLT